MAGGADRAADGDEAVSGVLDDHELRGDAARREAVVQLLRLAHRDEFVLLALHDEEGRVVRRDVGDGAGLRQGIRRAAEDRGEPALRVAVLRRCEVGGAEEVHHRLHAARLFRVLPDIPARALVRRAEQGDEVSARALADRAEAVGVEIVLRGVRT